jgi:hypothetical protein
VYAFLTSLLVLPAALVVRERLVGDDRRRTGAP